MYIQIQKRMYDFQLIDQFIKDKIEIGCTVLNENDVKVLNNITLYQV